MLWKANKSQYFLLSWIVFFICLQPSFCRVCFFFLIQANIAHTSAETDCLPPLHPRKCQIPYMRTHLFLDEWVLRQTPACFKGQGLHVSLCSHEDSLPLHGFFPNQQFLTLWESLLVMFYQFSFESCSMNRPVFFPPSAVFTGGSLLQVLYTSV